MADPKQIEQELKEFLEKDNNMRKSDRLAGIMAIINKHHEIDKIDHMINHSDISHLVNTAKASYAQTTMPMYVSKKEVYPSDANYVLMLESFIGYLNKNKLLKRLVKFDYGR